MRSLRFVSPLSAARGRALLCLVLGFAGATTALAQQDFGAPPPGGMPNAPPASAYPPPQGNTGWPPAGQVPSQNPNAWPSTPAPPNTSSGYGQAPPQQGDGMPALQGLLQAEMQDFGVPPRNELQTTLHGPTPTSIPGGQVITTDRLLPMLQQGQASVFHVLGPGGEMLPGALAAAPASQAGSFDDRTQQEFGAFLQQTTQGNRAKPLVFYCMNPQCWRSYNAALRAIRMGYTQVYWYRGGLEAWQQARQLAAGMSPQGMPQQGMQGQMPTGYR